MKLIDKIWETQNTHLWLAKPRPIAIESGETVIQHHCARCGRDFVTDPSSDSQIAVFVSAISFHRLRDEVTKRWLTEDCPRARLSSDDEDRKRRIAELKVVNDEGLLAVAKRTDPAMRGHRNQNEGARRCRRIWYGSTEVGI